MNFTHYGRIPNIASVLRSEIAPLARKEVKQQTESLKQAAASYGSLQARRSPDTAWETELWRLVGRMTSAAWPGNRAQER